MALVCFGSLIFSIIVMLWYSMTAVFKNWICHVGLTHSPLKGNTATVYKNSIAFYTEKRNLGFLLGGLMAKIDKNVEHFACVKFEVCVWVYVCAHVCAAVLDTIYGFRLIVFLSYYDSHKVIAFSSGDFSCILLGILTCMSWRAAVRA